MYDNGSYGDRPRRGGRPRSAGPRDGATADDSRDAPAEPVDPVATAREICLRLLTVRARTRAELHTALLKRGTDEDVANSVLSRLDEVGLVDDAAFAEQWVRSRHTYQGMSRRALAAELRNKGVDGPLAAEAVEAVDSEAEEAKARELVRKRLRSLHTADDLTRIRRLVGMLARKGYAEGMAYRVVRDELRTAGAEATLLDNTVPD
jgi:regulatory protein